MELFLAPVKLNISGCDKIKIVPGFSLYYNEQLIKPQQTYSCNYNCVDTIRLAGWETVFSGESFDNTIIPYKWQILTDNGLVQIHISFFGNNDLSEASAAINHKTGYIQVNLITKTSQPLTIDPLFHPLGSLLMVYLAYYSGGMLIHASGVKDNNKGYLFTGVSGIGKSTMSRLWKEKGAEVINDDRLWLHMVNGKWHMFNTPMMHYAQKPLMAPLNKAFLLQQAEENSCTEVTGTQSALRLMANCIQHFYNKEVTSAHLDRIINLTSQTPVYDLGFKPDTGIVNLIRAM